MMKIRTLTHVNLSHLLKKPTIIITIIIAQMRKIKRIQEILPLKKNHVHKRLYQAIHVLLAMTRIIQVMHTNVSNVIKMCMCLTDVRFRLDRMKVTYPNEFAPHAILRNKNLHDLKILKK